MPRRTVQITIKLPLEVAEFFVEHGSQITRALKDAVYEAKRSIAAARAPEDERRRERERQERNKQFLTDGRNAHRLLRHRLAALPSNIQKHERAKARKAFIDDIAKDLGEPFLLVEIAVQRHRKTLFTRIRERRQLRVLRYVIQGLSNREIAGLLRFSRGTITRDIQELRIEAKKLGLSLFDLEREKSARKARSATVSDTSDNDTIIKWADIKSARGRV